VQMMTRDTRVDIDDISHGMVNLVCYHHTDIAAKARTSLSNAGSLRRYRGKNRRSAIGPVRRGNAAQFVVQNALLRAVSLATKEPRQP